MGWFWLSMISALVGSRLNSSAYLMDATLSILMGDPSLVELATGVVGSSFWLDFVVELAFVEFIGFLSL